MNLKIRKPPSAGKHSIGPLNIPATLAPYQRAAKEELERSEQHGPVRILMKDGKRVP